MHASQPRLALLMFGLLAVGLGFLPAILNMFSINMTQSLNWLGDGFLLLSIICCWNFFNGSPGTIDPGYTTYSGVSAYITAIAFTQSGLPFVSCIGIGIIGSIVYSLIIGRLILRLKGIYFSIAALAVLIGTRSLIIAFRSITNGGIGLAVTLPYDAYRFYFVALILLMSIIITVWFIGQTPFRTILIAIRQDATLASIRGIPVMRYKQLTYSISALFMGMIGCLWIYRHPTIDPNSVFIETENFVVISAAIIGGYDSLRGSIIGGIITYVLHTELPGEWALIASATLLIAFVRYRRGGIISLWKPSQHQFDWFKQYAGSSHG